MLNNMQNSPGINCPMCGNKISVSLQDLLASKSIVCPHCLLELTMDREKSKSTLQAMNQLDTAIKNAEVAKKFEGRGR